jgi:hypothetical protein
MAEGFVHTVHKGGQWVNEIENRAQVGGAHSSKDEAVAAGRARAQQDGNQVCDSQRRRRDRGAELVRPRSVIPPRLTDMERRERHSTFLDRKVKDRNLSALPRFTRVANGD